MVRTGGNQIPNSTNKKTTVNDSPHKYNTRILALIVWTPHDIYIDSNTEIALSGYN